MLDFSFTETKPFIFLLKKVKGHARVEYRNTTLLIELPHNSIHTPLSKLQQGYLKNSFRVLTTVKISSSSNARPLGM